MTSIFSLPFQAKMKQVCDESSLSFGSTLPDESQTLLVDGKVLMLGQSPFRIDILTKIDGVTYDANELRFWLDKPTL